MDPRAYTAPSMVVDRFDGEVRTDVIVESDGSTWTGWYGLGNPEDPSGGALG